MTAGAKQSLFNATFCLFGPGDEVLVAAPFWTSYPDLVMIARAEPVPVFGDEADGFKLTPAALEAASNERTRGLILNTPCNPTGAVYTLEELRALAEWARDRGVWLICDEIYGNIYHEDDRATAPGLLDLPEKSLGDFVLVDGASKSYAMTGWRAGLFLVRTGARQEVRRPPEPDHLEHEHPVAGRHARGIQQRGGRLGVDRGDGGGLPAPA